MAIYKPTNCTPFLTTFDCRIEAADDPVFFECRIDSSNRNAVGYSVTVYDENNDQVFPPNTAKEGQPPAYPAPDEHISQVSDLRLLTGTGNAATETPFMIQSSGYSNLNTGLNGSYLKFPFFLNSSYWQNSTGDTDQSAFKSVNTVYYDSVTEKLYWYDSTESGATKREVPMYNGNTYKWVITLYQGDNAGVTPIPVDKTDAYKYFDMQLTAGEVMGSCDERIQTVYSENVYIDYYIEPVAINFTSYNSPTDWSGTVTTLDSAKNTRTRIKNIDSTYGYIYPQFDDYAYPNDTIKRGVAQGYRVYRMGNNPDVLTTTRIVNFGTDERAIPFDWVDNLAEASTSYGEIKFYVPTSSRIDTQISRGGGLGNYFIINSNTISALEIPLFNFIALKSQEVSGEEESGDQQLGEEVVRWFLVDGATWNVNTDTRILLNAQPSAGNGEDEPYEGASNPGDGGTRPYHAMHGQTSASIVNKSDEGSAYNGIYVPRYGGSTEVTLNVWGGPENAQVQIASGITFNEYTVSLDRATDADTWGEIMNKIVYVQGSGNLSGGNMQTAVWDESKQEYVYDSTQEGTINQTAVKFTSENPVQLYNYENTTNKDINNVGIIFYNGGEDITKPKENKLYISPFTGIKRGMYWIEQGNKSALEKRRFIIKYVDEKYWYVTYDNGMANGTYPNSFTFPERETPYVIKSYFRDSDENPFDLYENPTIDLKVYRDENHTYDEDAKTSQGKYENPPKDSPYMNADGSYCIIEKFGSSNIDLLRVDRRSIWVEADYNQADFISWRSVQWFLYDGATTNGNLLQSTDTYFDGKLGHQFYGLEQNHVYTIVLVLETNSGLTLSKDIQIITDFSIADVSNFPFSLEYQCETQSVYMRFGLSGFILPNLKGDEDDRVQNLNNEEEGTSPAIPGVTYSDYNNGQGWMNIDGTNTSFPDEGVTYQYIVSVLNGDEAAATQMSSQEEDGTFTFESRHIVDATNSWGNIVGFQYISDEEENNAFSSQNQVQIFLPDYNTTYTYDGVNYDYIDDKLLYQMRYQVGAFEGIPTIVNKDNNAMVSERGIWGTETDAEGNKTTTAPLIVSGWLQDGLSSSAIGYAVRPSGYEVIVIDQTSPHYSPIEDGSGAHYKESRFDFLGNNGSADSDDPIVAWSRRSTIYGDFMVHTEDNPDGDDYHVFQVRATPGTGATTYDDFQVIGTNPSLWSDNELERKTIITGGNRTITWSADGETVSYGNTTTQSREVENLDSHWVWDDGSGEHDTDNTAYDVSSANAKFWVDGDDNGTLKLYHQTEYASSSSSSAAWSTTNLRTGMDKYDFTFHMAVKNLFVGATEDDIQVQVFRGEAQDNID